MVITRSATPTLVSFERGRLMWTRRPEHWSFPGETLTDVAVESVDSATTLHFARRLAPVIDAGALIADSSDLPSSVSMVTLLGHELESVALRTLAIAASRTSAGGPVAVYGLDFAAGSLRMLEPLPHVGSMIGGGGDDIERIIRLFRLLQAELEARGNRFAEATASTIAEYRALANRPNEPPERAAHPAAHRRVRGLSGRLGGRERPVELVRRVPQHPLGWSSAGHPRGFYRLPGQPARGARRRKPPGLSADPGRCRAG
ncbi:FtsK/SpoIIIE domain-containing protein [Cryobacterium sp. TMS1-13-1]|uniref:FtsK/SpoIIIE domain-containing protein n=1 Tax=Cryobacterium sp. TMS1-13-1 TaxID=1259220 RepID=UPI001F547102|nr:FtsK/SpoIIIE domain-containing protein [Cryobacterium sp. TMS1-13-1]